MSAMSFGGSPTNGLEWMAIFACSSLYHENWHSMMSANIKPYNSNLHLLLGLDTSGFETDNIMALWSSMMFFGQNGSPMPIQNAWFQAAIQGYQLDKPNYTGVIKFAVAGDSACSGDTLTSNSAPTGTWFYNSQQVYPAP
jgi:hypothetical protein